MKLVAGDTPSRCIDWIISGIDCAGGSTPFAFILAARVGPQEMSQARLPGSTCGSREYKPLTAHGEEAIALVWITLVGTLKDVVHCGLGHSM